MPAFKRRLAALCLIDTQVIRIDGLSQPARFRRVLAKWPAAAQP